MILKEQIHKLYRGLTLSCSPQAFQRNANTLMRKHDLPRHMAFAFAYSVLSWACERMSTDIRHQLGKEDGKKDECIRRFLTPAELKEAEKYTGYLRSMEEEKMNPLAEGKIDPLAELKDLDAAQGRRPLMEQRPSVTDVVNNIETDLKKGILVSLARMMREMGYERWPHDKEGREDIQKVIDAVSKEMVSMGRRFNTLMRDEMRVLKAKGPENYARIMRKWLVGKQSDMDAEKPKAKLTKVPGGKEKPELKKVAENEPEEEPKKKAAKG